MTIRMNIKQLSNAAFRKECERLEREQRLRNVVASILIVLFIVLAMVVISEVSMAIGSEVRLPFAVR